MNLISPESSEPEIVPFISSYPPGKRVIVLAPHPDDETLGCGGSIRILLKGGRDVKVIFLTKGEKAAPEEDSVRYALVREKEAIKAMDIIGVTDYEFLRFPDREMYPHIEKIKEILSGIIEKYNPDTIYSPSIIELNPDHRASASLALDFLKEQGKCAVFYELTTPLRPNLLIDISEEFEVKKNAIEEYRSQINIIDYLKFIHSLNTYRSITLGKGVSYAEAFWMLTNRSDAERLDLWLSFQDKYTAPQ